LKRAALGGPSTQPAAPDPVSVVTTPAGVTTRSTWLSLSSTTMLAPAGSNRTPVGYLKKAALPTPFASPAAALPARVVTRKEARESKRTRKPYVSAIAISDPSALIASPLTRFTAAAVAKPSVLPQAACVVRLFTAPLGARVRSRQGAAESAVYSSPAGSGPAIA